MIRPKAPYNSPMFEIIPNVTAAIAVILIVLQLVACSARTNEHTYETDDTKYFNGEILPPDYVHEDTLVVIDAAFLNYLMENYDVASDGDISDCLRVTTRKK